jgi:Zn-dependent protease
MNIFNEFLIFLRALIVSLPGIYLAVVLHEYFHGYAAYKNGDSTAKNMGRLTLNPFAHIDIVGTIILPIFLLLLRSNILFAYAKPVPINPAYFRDYRKGIRYTSLAGPATNLILAFLLGSVMGLFYLTLNATTDFAQIQFITGNFSSSFFQITYDILNRAILINIFLAIFNLIPIPPLDGSKIVASFLPNNAMYRYLSIGRIGFILIFAFLLLGGGIFWRMFSPFINFIYRASLWWTNFVF